MTVERLLLLAILLGVIGLLLGIRIDLR